MTKMLVLLYTMEDISKIYPVLITTVFQSGWQKSHSINLVFESKPCTFYEGLLSKMLEILKEINHLNFLN